MFANVITVTQGELLSGSVYKTITDRVYLLIQSLMLFIRNIIDLLGYNSKIPQVG